MKLYTACLFILISSTLFGQLDKVSKINVSDSTIVINDSTVLSYPMNVESLTAVFGEARLNTNSKSPNQLYFWDKFGLVAFTKKGSVEITSFEICLSRSSIGPNSRRKFKGNLLINNSVITKKTSIPELSIFGYDTDKPDDVLPSWHNLELDGLKIVIETERNDKRLTGIGISRRIK